MLRELIKFFDNSQECCGKAAKKDETVTRKSAAPVSHVALT